MYVSLFGMYFSKDCKFAKSVTSEYLEHYHIEVDNLSDVTTLYTLLCEKWLNIFHYFDPNQISSIVKSGLHAIVDDNETADVVRYKNTLMLNKINKVVKKNDNQLSLF